MNNFVKIWFFCHDSLFDVFWLFLLFCDLLKLWDWSLDRILESFSIILEIRSPGITEPSIWTSSSLKRSFHTEYLIDPVLPSSRSSVSETMSFWLEVPSWHFVDNNYGNLAEREAYQIYASRRVRKLISKTSKKLNCLEFFKIQSSPLYEKFCHAQVLELDKE